VKFAAIESESTVHPGEYLLHSPSQQIVLCGAFKRAEGKIKVMVNGRIMEDVISNFQKILVNKKDRQQERALRRSCGGCKK
jgi:hypothetical protein